MHFSHSARTDRRKDFVGAELIAKRKSSTSRSSDCATEGRLKRFAFQSLALKSRAGKTARPTADCKG